MKQYRIGDFAKYLGVTPDLLKHYEELGLVQSVRRDSGYRYYSFNETMVLIESIRLRNFGLTLREISEILKLHKLESEEVDRRLLENMGHMRQEIQLDEAVIEEYERFLEWKAPLEKHPFDWEIRRSRPVCFLPHTNRFDFLHDSRIYELLSDWMSYIPVVKSCMKVKEDGQIIWGLSVEEHWLRKLGLPVNDIVEHLPSQKVFYYKFRAPLVRTDEETDAETHPAISLLHSLGLKQNGPYYRVTLMPADWKQDISRQYGFYAVPLSEYGTEGE